MIFEGWCIGDRVVDGVVECLFCVCMVWSRLISRSRDNFNFVIQEVIIRCVVCKLCGRGLNKTLRDSTYGLIGKEQCGFKCGKRCID